MGAQYEKVKAADGKMRRKKVLSVVAPDLVPYCYKHTYGTDLQRAGVLLNVAKALIGHEDVNITASIYTPYRRRDGHSQKISQRFTPKLQMIKPGFLSRFFFLLD